MISRALFLGAVAAIGPAVAAAQQNPAIRTEQPTAPAAAVNEGANSFNEAQARSRIEKAGYSAVEQLALRSDGIWTGFAVKDKRRVAVMLDYQGNVSQQ